MSHAPASFQYSMEAQMSRRRALNLIKEIKHKREKLNFIDPSLKQMYYRQKIEISDEIWIKFFKVKLKS